MRSLEKRLENLAAKQQQISERRTRHVLRLLDNGRAPFRAFDPSHHHVQMTPTEHSVWPDGTLVFNSFRPSTLTDGDGTLWELSRRLGAVASHSNHT